MDVINLEFLFCFISDACHGNPCGDYGDCALHEAHYLCTCHRGFEGMHCDTGKYPTLDIEYSKCN